MRIADALNEARTLGVPRLDAQWLLEHLLGRPRSWLLAHDDETLSATQAEAWPLLLARRASGEPLAYITGQREFCGMALQVSPAVLVPRPETELLVDWALACLPTDSPAEVADLGTGSGAIALALQRARPMARVTATDASTQALAVARANAARFGPGLELLAGDWWGPLAGRRFDLVVSNPPYIAGDDEHLATLGHEPRSALTPEGDGLTALRRIIGGAAAHMRPGAWLLLEHGHDQGRAVRQMLQDAGLEQPTTRPDLAGMDRCSGARRPGAN